jgi:Zn-dependent protease
MNGGRLGPSRKDIALRNSFSWKIGRVEGIDLYVHPTFLILLIPGAVDVVVGGRFFGLFFLLAVFGCVVLHELGHALAARQFGIATRDITLYPIGGVARLERMPRAPGAELVIALAGPAVNFVIAATLAALSALFAGDVEIASSGLFGGLLGALITANIFLALFNLLPAFPMDGGRVLRALLSGSMGRARATAVAARIGRAMAVIFGIAGLWMWQPVLVLVAVFVYMVSRAEEAQVLADEERRTYGLDGRGVWVAPPGYRWVDMGNGSWQLAPVVVTASAAGAGAHQDAWPWR